MRKVILSDWIDRPENAKLREWLHGERFWKYVVYAVSLPFTKEVWLKTGSTVISGYYLDDHDVSKFIERLQDCERRAKDRQQYRRLVQTAFFGLINKLSGRG